MANLRGGFVWYNGVCALSAPGAPPMTPLPVGQAGPFPVTPVPPELLAWAQQTLDADAFAAEVQAVEASGGVPFEAVIAAVEAAVRDES